MAIRIKQISIQNFKAFETFPVKFGNSNLVVFDGPNGFGKTSFYDAIELLLTGSVMVQRELDKCLLQLTPASPLARRFFEA